jgi:hypothetical protein
MHQHENGIESPDELFISEKTEERDSTPRLSIHDTFHQETNLGLADLSLF